MRRRGDLYGKRVRRALAAAASTKGIASSTAGNTRFVAVAVLDVLYFLVPCLELATRQVPIVLVDNGLPAWERLLLAERLPHLSWIDLEPIGRSIFPAYRSVNGNYNRNLPVA